MYRRPRSVRKTREMTTVGVGVRGRSFTDRQGCANASQRGAKREPGVRTGYINEIYQTILKPGYIHLKCVSSLTTEQKKRLKIISGILWRSLLRQYGKCKI